MANEADPWVNFYEDMEYEDLARAEWHRFMHAEEKITTGDKIIAMLPWVVFCLILSALLFWVCTCK